MDSNEDSEMSMPIRVLMIEDSKDDAALIMHELKRNGYEVMSERVDTQKTMEDALDRQEWDVIIADYSIPQFDTMKAFKLIQERNGDLPFILVSGVIGEDVAVEAMKLGVHDYIMKANMARLGHAVERALRETERLQHTRQIEVQFKKLSRAVEHSPSSIVITDKNGKIEYVNPRFTMITGYTTEEAIGRSMRIMKSGKQSAELYRELWDTISSGKEWRGDLCNKKKSGEHHWESVSISSVTNGGGKIANYIAVKEDITERKNMEEVIRRHHDELEEQVEERTARIMGLEQKRVEGEKLAVAGRLAAQVAHEINNPLAGIKGGFTLIKGAIPKDYKHYEYVGMIDGEIDRIARIVKQMFNLCRPFQGKITEFDPAVPVREVVSMLRNLSNEHSVTVNIGGFEDTVKVTMSEDFFRQILFNIVKNAIEATPDGSEVNIVNIRNQDDRLIIMVSDQGGGISDELRSKIFEPFFTTKDKHSDSGLGLGLATTKGIVEAMGGSLDLTSKEGKGTTFIIDLPTSVVKEKSINPSMS